MTDLKKDIQNELQKLLEMLSIEASIKVEEDDDSLKAEVDAGEENAFLIGKHGNTLAALELVLKMIISQKTGEYHQITIEIGNYRQEREEYLEGLSTRLKEEVAESGEPRPIKGLKPWERRFVHMLLKDDDEVYTESEGEGRDRALVIKRK